MQRHSLAPRPEELELKLALPASLPGSLLARLSRIPVLARRSATQLQLHSTYYDTPKQQLRRQRVALRIRRVGPDTAPQWLQTLKTADRGDSALSRRGEWETPVAGAALERDALPASPWSDIDPRGTLFASLVPCFTTQFERTLWQVRTRSGSVVEVALDLGHILAGEHSAPICELELELKAGPPQALFDLAQQIARSMAVLPTSASKAERGYALAAGRLDAPRLAQPPRLKPRLLRPEAAQRVLREAFDQFSANLLTLRNADNPELVHQARIGWRRFKTALRLFKPVIDDASRPSWQPLAPLLECLGAVRDHDVAMASTLPALAGAYAGTHAQRAQAWQTMVQALEQAVQLQRKAVRYALETPALGATLLATTQWLEGACIPHPGSDPDAAPDPRKPPLRAWAQRRMARLRTQYKRALRAGQKSGDPQRQHRSRLLAKRLRYSIECLHTLLPRRYTGRMHRQTMRVQTQLGALRDMERAAALVAALEVNPGLAGFLRGVAVGRKGA